MFFGIVCENIVYGKLDVSDEEIEYVVKFVYFFKVVEEMLDGFDIIIGECGVKFFGG